jgi:hypothetical protein
MIEWISDCFSTWVEAKAIAKVLEKSDIVIENFPVENYSVKCKYFPRASIMSTLFS